MKNRILIDLLGIFLLYAVYWVVIYFAGLQEYNLLFDLGIFPPATLDMTQFLVDFNAWAQLVLAISLVATLSWYVLGEWGPKPHLTSKSTWVAIWLIGLVLVLIGGFVAFELGPIPSLNPELLAAFYMVSGALFYYLATMLFSPVSVKYVVIGSKLFRRW